MVGKSFIIIIIIITYCDHSSGREREQQLIWRNNVGYLGLKVVMMGFFLWGKQVTQTHSQRNTVRYLWEVRVHVLSIEVP